MREINVFNSISLDGYFVDGRNPNSMDWAHKDDPEWRKFSEGNAQSGEGTFLFGRKTYDMMAAFWPTPMARQQLPRIADAMNGHQKYVASRTLTEVTWSNTTLLEGNLVTAVKQLKDGSGGPIVIMGSGSLVAQLSLHRLIDLYTLVTVPIVLGAGRTLFEGLDQPLPLKRTSTRTFENGNVVSTYELA